MKNEAIKTGDKVKVNKGRCGEGTILTVESVYTEVHSGRGCFHGSGWDRGHSVHGSFYFDECKLVAAIS